VTKFAGVQTYFNIHRSSSRTAQTEEKMGESAVPTGPALEACSKEAPRDQVSPEFMEQRRAGLAHRMNEDAGGRRVAIIPALSLPLNRKQQRTRHYAQPLSLTSNSQDMKEPQCHPPWQTESLGSKAGE
jgi:hypothetical protein